MIKKLLWRLIDRLGRPIRDERTSLLLGRGLVFRWMGHTWLIGLHRPYVRPVFLPQTSVKYARHRLGFATHEPVNYPRLCPPGNMSKGQNVLWAILFHQPPSECDAILDHWRRLAYPMDHILIIHGGNEADFAKLSHTHKVFVPDQNLRTRRHPVEKQSYAGPLREAARWLTQRPSFNYICLLEYDHLPVVPDWGSHLVRQAEADKADVLFHHLTRVDGTNAPHYLYHLSDPEFLDTWKVFSLREDPKVVLNCIATGSFWRRDAFEAAAHHPESHPIYLEMYLPTLAHHLGFRVRDYGTQNAFVDFDPLSLPRIKTSLASEAWSLHPVKDPSLLRPL